MAKTIHVSCPKCATLLTMTKGMFSWNPAKCPKCNIVVKPEDVRKSVAYCPACNRDIAFDILKDNLDKCPICRGPLEFSHNQVPSRTVSCPFCNSSMEIDGKETGPIHCDYCKKMFSLTPVKHTLVPPVSDPVPSSAPAAAPAPASRTLRISSEDMSDEYVLWRHPATHINSDSVIALQPGTIALLVSGDHCVGIQTESGALKLDAPDTSIRVIFARPHFTYEKCWGMGYIQLRDAYYRISPRIMDFENRPRSYGKLAVQINDIDAFARKLQFRSCTRQEVDRALSAENVFPAQRIMEQACQRVIDERHCSLTELIDYKEDVLLFFQSFANNFLMREWGLSVNNCSIDLYPAVTNEMLDIISDVETVLTMPLSWKTRPFSIHLPNKDDYTSTVEVYGTFQLSLMDEQLRPHPDVRRWKVARDPSMPAREVSSFLGDQLYAVLQLMLQDHMNSHDQMVPSRLQTYLYRIQQDLMVVMNSDLTYLYDHGLQITSFNMVLNVVDESPLMRTWNKRREVSELDAMQRDIELTQREKRIYDEEENAREQLRIYLARVNAVESKKQADETIAQNQHQRDVNAMMRASEREEVRTDLDHRQNVRRVQQSSILREMEERAHADSVNRSFTLNRTAADARRSEELADREHAMRMTTLNSNIEREKLNLQADRDAYTRGNAVANARAQADIVREGAQGKADADVYAGEARLHLAAEAQNLAQQSARAAQELAQDKANAEFSRSMEQAQFQMERRTVELDAEMKRQALQADIEKLRLALDHLTQHDIQEAAAARSNALAAADRLRSQREFELKSREQDNRLTLERERLQTQRSEQSKADASRAEKLMDELRRLQRECAASASGSARNDEYAAMQRQLSDLQYSIENLVKNLAAGLNGGTAPVERPASPFDAPRGGFGEVNRPDSPFGGYDSSKMFKQNAEPQSAPAPRQPGMTFDSNVCPSCGRPVSRFSRSCLYCGAALKS